MNGTLPVDGFVESVAMAVLVISMLLAFVRLLRGPTLPDRVVALDHITIIGLAVLALYAVASEQSVYLDIGIVLTLVTFLVTIAFAYYIEKGTSRRGTR